MVCVFHRYQESDPLQPNKKKRELFSRQHVWAQCEAHFSTNLRLVALPSPPCYSSPFTSSCTAQSTPPPIPLIIPHLALSIHLHPQDAPSLSHQLSGRSRITGFFSHLIQSRNRLVLDHTRRTSRFSTGAQGYSDRQVKPFSVHVDILVSW